MAKALFTRIRGLADKAFSVLGPYLLLAIRILVGYALFRGGWGKLTHLDQTAAFFEHVGIPMPKVNALVVGACECTGGLLFMAGMATRFAAGMVAVILTVALLTAHRADLAQLFKNPSAVVAAAPMPYLLTFLAVGIHGPGPLSVDHKLFGRKS